MIPMYLESHKRFEFPLIDSSAFNIMAANMTTQVEPNFENGPDPENTGRWFAAGRILMIVLVAISCSCNREKKQVDNVEENGFELDLEAIRARYQNADGYRDEASLVLNYELNGIPIEESHPFSSELSRTGISRFHRFQLELLGSSSGSIARVLDAATQNLDGQVLCTSLSPTRMWQATEADAIARHFAMGIDEIPWNPKIDTVSMSRVLGLPARLFAGQAPAWFSREKLLESRLVESNGVQFADATFETDFGVIACRIDIHENSVVGMRLPHGLLAKEIGQAVAVKNLSFALLFRKQSFELTRPPTLKLDPNERAVSKFVRLPEVFPSPMIGKKMEDWNLVDSSQRPYRVTESKKGGLFIYGAPTVFGPAELTKLDRVASRKRSNRFAWIFPPSSGPDQEAPLSGWDCFLDKSGTVLQKMDVGVTCFLFVTDDSGTIQFVVKRKKDWLDELDGVLDRIGRGDDVAREMHEEYSNYFANYQQALADNAVDPAVLAALGQD